MHVEQIYTGCLAHAAYYLESKGEAAIFDPLREVVAVAVIRAVPESWTGDMPMPRMKAETS